ncbi:MAG: heparinase II/III family protein [Acidobacteriota bacterium]
MPVVTRSILLLASAMAAHSADAPAAAAANRLKLELRIPAKHPYLALTPEDIARARERAGRQEWAKQALAKALSDAGAHVQRPWGKLPEKGDTEHRNLANRLFSAALAYALSGEMRYAEWTRDGLLAYAGIYPALPMTRLRSKVFTQSSLYEATWLVQMVQAYDLIADSGVFTGEQKKHVETDLLRAAVACFKIDDFQGDPRIKDLHYRCYNFQAWHLSAIGLVGLAVKDAGLVDYAVNSPYGFRHLLAHDVRDDGLFWERSVGYHQFVISALLPLTEALAHCGFDSYKLSVPNDRSRDENAHYLTDTSDRPKSLRLLFEAPFYLAFPDLSYPALGDSSRGPLRPAWQELVGYHRYRDPKLAALLARGVSQPARARDWRWLVYDSPPDSRSPLGFPLRDGRFANSGEYRNGCSLFPSSGVAVLREAAGDFTARRESTAVSLSYGPYGGGHGHPDKLGIVLYAQGRQWIPDFGSMPYETHWKAEWTAHTISHNTLVVDGVSQRPSGARNTQWPTDDASDRVAGKLERFEPREKLVSASCDRAYEGFVLRRAVRLSGHLVVDDFAVSAAGETPHQFDYVLHIDGELAESSAPLEPRSGRLGERCGYQHVQQRRGGTAAGVVALTFAAGNERLRIWIVSNERTPAEVVLAEGLTNSPDVKMPMLVVRRKAPRSRFVTVFEPVRADNPLRGIRVEAAADGEPAALLLESAQPVRRVPLGVERTGRRPPA